MRILNVDEAIERSRKASMERLNEEVSRRFFSISEKEAWSRFTKGLDWFAPQSNRANELV